MAINDFVRQSGDAFVSRLGPKAQTNALDKGTVQAEYRAMTEAFTPQAQEQLAAYMTQRFAEPENRWLFAVLEMVAPPTSAAPAAKATVTPQIQSALDAIDGATQLPAADRAKLKALITNGANGRDVPVKIERDRNGAVSIEIGARGRRLAMTGAAPELSAHVERFQRGADDQAKWDGGSGYVYNRLSLGFDQVDPGANGLRGYEAAAIAGHQTKSHMDGAPLESVMTIAIPNAKGQLPGDAQLLKIKDAPFTSHRGRIGAMVTTTFGWETAMNMGAASSQDVMFADGHVASTVYEGGAGMRGVFRWSA
ncbi:MAG: hypothetical protein RMA76_25585 [Deltaproteobacteria bacterium]|jgi:hypothetical protein